MPVLMKPGQHGVTRIRLTQGAGRHRTRQAGDRRLAGDVCADAGQGNERTIRPVLTIAPPPRAASARPTCLPTSIWPLRLWPEFVSMASSERSKMTHRPDQNAGVVVQQVDAAPPFDDAGHHRGNLDFGARRRSAARPPSLGAGWPPRSPLRRPRRDRPPPRARRPAPAPVRKHGQCPSRPRYTDRHFVGKAHRASS